MPSSAPAGPGGGLKTPARRVCVFTGSRDGARPEYRARAEELGRELARQGRGLVYGGASVGIMGALADAVLKEGGHVSGVIPEALEAKEVAHRGLTDLQIVDSMHERKQRMADLADAFVALPGGLGTLDELFEILTWAQLGLHAKPCALLNVAGYFDPLLGFLDRATAERFITHAHRAMLIVEERPRRLLERFDSYTAPETSKWIDREQR